jgi:hypothetical protein
MYDHLSQGSLYLWERAGGEGCVHVPFKEKADPFPYTLQKSFGT